MRMSKQDKKGLVPERRFPEFRNKGGWQVSKLKHLARCTNQRNVESGKTRVLTNSAEHGVVDQRDYFDKDIANQSNLEGYYIVEEGDYVYNPRVSILAPVGPISKNKIGTGVMSPLYTVFRFDNSNNEFFEHYFKTTKWHTYMRFVSNSGARHDRMAITADNFIDMPLPTPSSEEQQKIADCLTSLDELITAQTQKLDVLKAHKKGLMQHLFPSKGETVPNLRFPEFRNKGEWECEENTLENVCSSISSGRDKSDLNGAYDLYGSTGIIGKTSSGSYDGNFILVARVGANAGLLTRAKGKFGVTDNTLALVLKKPEDLDFIYYSLERFGPNKMVFGSGQPLITSGQLKSLDMCLPQPEEQQKIADCLSSFDTLIMAQTQKLDALKAVSYTHLTLPTIYSV